MALDGESAFRQAAVKGDGRRFRLDEEQDFKRRNRQVGVPLFTEIGATGRVAQNLDDDHGQILKMVGYRVRLADNHRVRVVEAGVIGKFDADFGVAVEGLAGFAAKACMQGPKAISGNDIVLVRRARHGVDGPAKILVLGVTEFLTREVVPHGDDILALQCGHGGTVAGQTGAGNLRNVSRLSQPGGRKQ